MPPEPAPLSLQIANWVLSIGSLGVWIFIVQRWRRGKPIVSHELRRPVPWQGVDLIFILLAFMLIAVLVGKMYQGGAEDRPAVSASKPAEAAPAGENHKPTEMTADRAKPLTPTDLIAEMTAKLLMAGIAVGWVVFRVRASSKDLGFDFSRLGFDVVLGAATLLATYVPVLLLQDFLDKKVESYDHPVIDSLMSRPDHWMLALTAITVVVVAPLVEELFFRVLVQGCFEAVEVKRRLLEMASRAARAGIPAASSGDAARAADDGNPSRSPSAPHEPSATDAELIAASGPAAWPILVSSILFALMHWGQGLAPIPLFFFALALGYVYQRTHRIWPSLVAHLLLNSASMITLWYLVTHQSK